MQKSAKGPRALGLICGYLAMGMCASAGVIYQTGFESPTYTAGGLTGQDGWTGSSVPLIQTTTAFNGTQAIEYDATGVSAQNREFRDIIYDSTVDPNQFVIGQVEMEISSTGTGPQWIPVTFRASNGGFFITQIIVDPGFRAYVGNQTTTVGGNLHVPLGVWNLYTVVLDFQSQQTTAFLNGQLIGSVPFSGIYTGVSRVGIGMNTAPGTDTAYYDSLSIVSSPTGVPEPSTLTLLVIGMGLILRRRN